jgi:ribonuclease-3
MTNSNSSSRDDLASLEHRIGHRFADRALLELALTHRSAARGQSARGQSARGQNARGQNARAGHNERLEFLGDAVLGQCVATHLYRELADAPESEMTLKRASLVRRETLATIARELELACCLRLGSGEHRSGVGNKDSVLSDALEALIGAVYLDGGQQAAERLVAHAMGDRFRALGRIETKDPKTRLQEYMQGRGMPLPRYEVVSTKGALHQQTFTVACLLDPLDLRSEGSGSSRREAEKAAATQLLALLARSHE